MAEWEAPMTLTCVGWSLGMVLARRVGERAVSRWISARWLTGRGPLMGDEPVQRMSLLASTCVGCADGSDGEIVTVHVDCALC